MHLALPLAEPNPQDLTVPKSIRPTDTCSVSSSPRLTTAGRMNTADPLKIEPVFTLKFTMLSEKLWEKIIRY
jgi:hypothetical protein